MRKGRLIHDAELNLRPRPSEGVLGIPEIPDEGISLQFSAKRPALQVQVENVAMDFDYSSVWPQSLPEAYERLLLDAMQGDASLFARSDEIELSWGLIDPILDSWESPEAQPLFFYQSGSWGPAEADQLLALEQ